MPHSNIKPIWDNEPVKESERNIETLLEPAQDGNSRGHCGVLEHRQKFFLSL